MLNEEQTSWLLQFTGGKPSDLYEQFRDTADPEMVAAVEKAQHDKARQRARRGALMHLRARVDAITRLYTELSTLEVEVFADDGTKVLIPLVQPDGKLSSAFNKHQDRLVDPNPTWKTQLLAEERALERVKDELLELTFEWSTLDDMGVEVEHEEPLFTTREVEDELYTPIVRQLLFPEDSVPDEFSAVQRMIDETNARYLDRLRSMDPEPSNQLDKSLDLTKQVVGTLAQLATTTADGIAAFDPTSTEACELAKTITTISQTVLETGIEVGRQLNRSEAITAADALLDGLSKTLKASLSAFLPKELSNPSAGDIADLVAASVQATRLGPAVVTTLSDPNMAPRDKGLGVLAAIENTLIESLSMVVVGGSDEEKANVALTQGLLKATVKAQVATFQTGGAMDKLESGDLKGAAMDFASIGMDVVVALGKRLAEEQKNQEKIAKEQGMKSLQARFDGCSSDTEREALVAELDADKPTGWSDLKGAWEAKGVFENGFDESKRSGVKIDDVVSSVHGAMDSDFDERAGSAETDSGAFLASLSGLVGDPGISPEQLQEDLARLREQAASNKELLTLSDGDFRLELEGASGMSPEAIGALIAKIQRDRKVFEIFMTAGKAGASVAAMFFAPMAAANTLLGMIEAAKQAAEHRRELLDWETNAELGQTAVSPYYSAALSFIQEEKSLFDHTAVQAVLKGVEFAAAVAGNVPLAAPVSKIVEGTAKAAQTIEEIVFTVGRERRADKAWALTKLALENPQDRITNLKAREMSPILAKYTIAWGATIEGDRVAVQMMATIGLTTDALQIPDAKADAAYDKLLSYLQVRYDQHMAITEHRLSSQEDQWFERVPLPVLSSRAWITTVGMGVEHGDLDRKSARPVEKELERCAGFAEQRKAVADEVTALEQESEPDRATRAGEALVSLSERLAGLERALDRYMPKTTDGRISLDMKGVVDGYVALVAQEKGRLQDLTGRLAAVGTRGTMPAPEDLARLIEQMRQAQAA